MQRQSIHWALRASRCVTRHWASALSKDVLPGASELEHAEDSATDDSHSRSAENFSAVWRKIDVVTRLMRVLVTGSSGFVGQALVNHLAAAGIVGYAVSREGKAPVPAGWRTFPREAALDGGALQAVGAPPPDWVIHLEVKQHVDAPTAADIADFEKINVRGTQRWLDWCAQAGVYRFMLFSTIKAVGESQQPQDDDATTPPSTPYGKAKRRGEESVQQWTKGDARREGVILRPAVIYGPGNRANIFSMVEGIDRRRFLHVGKNENIKSLVSIGNVVAAVQFLLGRQQVPGSIVYNLVDAQSYSVRAIAEIASSALGAPKPRSIPLFLARCLIGANGPIAALTGRSLPLTKSRLKALLETTHFLPNRLVGSGFLHPQSTHDGLVEMVKWYRLMEGIQK